MNVNLIGINCKYIHTNLAIRSLKKYCDVSGNISSNINLFEYTINNNLDDILEDIYANKADVIGFSVYLWNVEIIKNIICELKKVCPNTKILVGGPEVSYYSIKEFEDLGADFLIKRYGEKTFYELLHNLDNNQPLNTMKSFMYKDGEVVYNNSEINFANLEDIPFVYDDCLDDFENKIIYYEASRGCPYSCQYCLSSVEEGLYILPLERVFSDITFFLNNRVMQVKFCDRTFNANKNYAKNIWKFLIENDNNYTNFHFELSAEIIDQEMLDILSTAREGLIQFEIGIQSTNQQTLNEVARSINTESIFKNVRILNDLGNIHLHTDLIVGLPHEDFESFKKSFNDVYSLKAEQLQVGFLKLLKGSALRDNAPFHNMLYKSYAPYEILSNKWLSYDEILTLKAVENMVETFYNSRSFITTVDYFVYMYPTAFDFFLELSNYYKENDLQKFSHKKVKLYEHLFNFATYKNFDLAVVKNFIKYDILSKENLTILPDYLDTDANLKWTYLNDNSFVENNLGVYTNNFDKKAIARNIRFEDFTIDVATFIESGNILQKSTILMFDYLQKIQNPVASINIIKL